MSTLKVGAIRGVSASSDAITVANDGTCSANVTSINGGQLGNRNKIINGEAQVSQRGTISNHGTSAIYTAIDRFSTRIGSSFNFDVTSSQSTDAPDGFRNSLKLSPDSTQTPTGSANGAIQTKLEGQDLQDFAYGTSSAKSFTLSFYAKSGSAGAGTYSIELHYVNASGSVFQQTRAFTITSSWQRFSFTFEANGAATSNAIKNNNQDAFRVIWHLASGPDDQTSAITTWQNTAAMQTISGMDNFMSSTSNEFYLTGVQLEVGSVATDFEHRTFGDELAKCQRYFYRTSDDGSLTNLLPMSVEFSNSAAGGQPHPVTMRAIPTVSFGSGIRFFNSATGEITPSINSNRSGTTQLAVKITLSGATAGQAGTIFRQGSNGYIEVSSEL